MGAIFVRILDMSLALYRKYRPQRFVDLLGQDHIVGVLQKSLQSQKIHHAYLFIGSRGTGKTSTARILAKALNCLNFDEKSAEPCDKCLVCQSISEGRYLDLLEIDAASNRGIDEIRDLREKIKLSPTEGKFKVYIIDEVHMLTTEAFNALLKTLEEPPPHAYFILCTTDPQKLPQTIVSRCLRLEFKRPDVAEIGRKLEKIVKEEKIDASSDTLKAISEASSGAFRDAEVLLEKAISALGEKIAQVETHDLQNVLGVGNKESALDILRLMIEGKAPSALEWLDRFVKEGGELKILNFELLRQIRFMLLVKLGVGEQIVKKEISPRNYEFIQNYSSNLEKDKIIEVYTIFTQSLEYLKIAPIPELPLEIAIAQALDLFSQATRTTFSQKDEAGAKIQEESRIEKKDPPSPAKPDSEGQEKSVKEAFSDLSDLQSRWSSIVKDLKSYNHSLFALVSSAQLKDYDKRILTLEFPYAFHKDRLEEPKNLRLIEKVLSEALGETIRVKGVVGEKKKKNMGVEDIKNVERVSDEELIDRAIDIFNGKLEV